MSALKTQLSCLPALVANFDLNKVDLDQIAPGETVFFGFVSFREIPHEPGL